MRIRAVVYEDMSLALSKLHIITDDGTGRRRALMIDDKTVDVPTGCPMPLAYPPEHTRELVQAIMDAAWEVGMRPVGYEDERSSVKRIENHLEDMRRLVFNTQETR